MEAAKLLVIGYGKVVMELLVEVQMGSLLAGSVAGESNY